MCSEKSLLNRIQSRSCDPVGCVYEYEGRVLRIINKCAENHVKRIMKSGLIEALVKERLLVDTWYCKDIRIDNTLILEHRRVEVNSSVAQWSFEMIKQAALVMLKTNLICMEYGYELRDGHHDNILFDGTSPVYIDFGSIIRRQNNSSSEWRSRNIFLQGYYYPLQLWAKGYSHTMIAQFSGYPLMGDIKEMQCMYYSGIPTKYIELGKELVVRKKSAKEQLKYYIREIEKLDVETKTRWGDYQGTYWEEGPNKRFKYEIEWIRQREDIESLVEIGANQGNFAFLIAKGTQIKKIIATDYDIQAVNNMYKNLVRRNKRKNNITPLILDFCSCPIERMNKYSADIVVANALTHHLILSQGMDIKEIVKRLACLTNKYVIVEFMPNGVNNGFDLPDWYTIDWFINNMREYFDIISNHKIEKNRVVIIGKRSE